MRPALLCMTPLLEMVLFSQFRFRMKTERMLREREAHYRLLANNIAEHHHPDRCPQPAPLCLAIRREPWLGLRPNHLLGKSCFKTIHPEDRESVRSATARLNGIDTVSTVAFRTFRADGTLAWVESKFKLATAPSDPAQTDPVCVIRDVTERKRMEDEFDRKR